MSDDLPLQPWVPQPGSFAYRARYFTGSSIPPTAPAPLVAPSAAPLSSARITAVPPPAPRPSTLAPSTRRRAAVPARRAVTPTSHENQPQKKKAARKAKAGNEIQNNALRPHVLALDRLRTWTSPFALDYAASFRAELPEELVNQTYATLFSAYAPGSHSTYAAGLLRFHQWADKYEISERARMPASHFLLAAFIAEFVGSVGGGTVKAWMSGLRAWHDINHAPWHGEDRWVELARRTANKEGVDFKREQRGPVTIEHMRALRKTLVLSKPFDAAAWALACAAFWGCRRLGELTIPSSSSFDPKFHVQRSACRRRITSNGGSTSSTSIALPWTKSTRERGSSLIITARPDDLDLCPERALDNHLAVNAAVPPDAPLFAFVDSKGGWSPMTKPWFMDRCDGIWKAAKLLRVLGHSFRIGGSTELLLAGVACEVVAALGGWTSLAFLIYWRKVEHIIPAAIGKAYDKKRFADLAISFEAFRVANKIIIHDSTDDL